MILRVSGKLSVVAAKYNISIFLEESFYQVEYMVAGKKPVHNNVDVVILTNADINEMKERMLEHWISNPGVPSSKPLCLQKFYLIQSDDMSTRNSWGRSGKR